MSNQMKSKSGKLLPKMDGNYYYYNTIWFHNQIYYALVLSGSPDNKLNSKWGRRESGGYYKNNWIKTPKLSASVKVWKNFYRLFPALYAAMIEQRKADETTVRTKIPWNNHTQEYILRYIPGVELRCLKYSKDINKFWSGYMCDRRIKDVETVMISFEELHLKLQEPSNNNELSSNFEG